MEIRQSYFNNFYVLYFIFVFLVKQANSAETAGTGRPIKVGKLWLYSRHFKHYYDTVRIILMEQNMDRQGLEVSVVVPLLNEQDNIGFYGKLNFSSCLIVAVYRHVLTC